MHAYAPNMQASPHSSAQLWCLWSSAHGLLSRPMTNPSSMTQASHFVCPSSRDLFCKLIKGLTKASWVHVSPGFVERRVQLSLQRPEQPPAATEEPAVRRPEWRLVFDTTLCFEVRLI